MPNWKPLTDEELDAQIEAARERSLREHEAEPLAVAVRFDSDSKKFVVDLSNETTFIFPARLCQGLTDASDAELADVAITPSGTGLMWERLDAGLTIPGLMKGIFGTKAWMAELGKKGGAATSPVKAKASRENGKKGGRPKKSAL
jgi:hypothetical protein